ncbi:MAG: OmpA family protein [Muricauda sp.]|jgi:outer membrane protein OmpA-like peptidoglycan-associated protein|nr:OmpA family protein [Allomuricauda sp.]MBO6589338.1 OmpA family protein [Allomuricauda sp.]MBO6619230.1 OmpA family protein [Allomuricauda sp.]MBO6644875.1 OmpA family protein [Allomuricauda sp.]MBO6747350.1 OmpA family protein [Allomuricauda sp.]MBO6845861.1 OmpA family protein [Allomuricauda sp.]
MLKRILIVSIIIYGCFQKATAQQDSIPDKQIERIMERADERYQQYSFSPAIDIYKKVLDRGYSSSDLLKKLGNSYYFNAKYQEAADTYGKLEKSYPNDMSVEDIFRYAQSLKSIGNYDESNRVMENFRELTAAMVDFDVDYMAKIEENSGRYDIKPFPYNSAYSDFAAAYYEKGLIFASDRDTGNFARYRHTWNASDFLDLYKVDADSASQGKVMKLEGDVNTRLHESTSVVTKDGTTMYFTRNNFFDGRRKKDEEGIIRLKIYSAEYVDGEWTNIVELPFNSDSYSVAHPMLSPDEKKLYFVSDMTGSLGASDIFVTEIIGDGTYGPIQNLGSNVNTIGRETFPYITEEGVLYFSSDGHQGLGGLDVFATKITYNDYSQPVVNVGRPVNSPKDDFSFIYRANDKTGYFASNREGGMGGDDIYEFVETEPLTLDCIQEVTGTVRDRISNEVLAGATVKIIDEENNEISSTITDSDGNYLLMLDCSKGNFVRASRDGYVPAEEYLPISDGKPRIVDFYLERDLVTGGFGDDLAKLLQLSTIYFDLNKYDIRPDAEIEIQKVIVAMEKYPSLKIKVNSHTDSRGVDAYNLWLSQKRAESTVNYMISKGIAPDRLEGEGFGETRLVNDCINGIPCSEEQHQLNRRSEFIIFE